MSVQTQIDRLNAEVMSQSGLLDQAIAALQGKAGGGGGNTGGGGTDISGAILDSTVTEISNSDADELGEYRLRGCTALKSLSLPNAERVQTYACYGCTSLQSASFPKAVSLASYAFYGCKALSNLYIPKVINFNQNCLRDCTALTVLDLPKIQTIQANSMYGCTNLSTIILRHTSVVSLTATSAFTNTPYASGKAGGKVYVPRSLIASYQTATNWKTLYGYGTCEFVAIEGSEYE